MSASIKEQNWMDNPSPETKDNTNEPPAPEVLTPRVDGSSADGTPVPNAAEATTTKPKQARMRTYRPSHKATFIGLIAVVVILLINAVIIGIVVKSQAKNNNTKNLGQVTVSQSVLSGLGVNRSPVGNSGIVLTVGPDTKFEGQVTVAGNVSVAGQLRLNDTFSAANANLAQLQAGNTTLSQLNVSGNSTLSSVSLRGNLVVAGSSQLQGSVTIAQLLTVNNNESVSGNLAVGGTLAANVVTANSVTAIANLTIAGHVTTGGSVPGISPGSALGSNGTVSISGNDAAGTVAVNIGVGANAGTLASITFHNRYATTPHVVITPIGASAGNFYINRSATGFSIVVSSPLSPGGYAFDYIVEE